MKDIKNQAVAAVFGNYPVRQRKKLMRLRKLILAAAQQSDTVEQLEETLKWGEPSYVAKKGSTVRLGWKEKYPDQYGIYFQCQTSLVETFRELYSDQLTFDGNRAIIFKADDDIPEEIVRHCVTLSLNYHRLKHLPMLGV